nr:phage tail protein [uncultured Brevundimonas sp.]
MTLKRFLTASALALSFVVSAPAVANADPVSAAIVTYIGFTGTAAAVATFAINTALYAAGTWAIGKATQALGLNKNVVQERQAAVTSLTLGETPREMIVGVACTGGSLADAFNFGGKYGTDWVTRCVLLADHALEGIVGYYVDDAYYPWNGEGPQAGFNGKLSFYFKNATPDGHPPQQHVAQNGGWLASDRLCGIAAMWIDYKADEELWTQGHPRFRFVVRGLRAYDMRKDRAFGYTGPDPQTWEDRSTHTFTRNAALLRYAYQRGIYAEGRQGQVEHLLIGRGLSAEEAPPARIIAAANLCDELVDGQIRYAADGVISAAQAFIDVEEMFKAAMAGEIVQREGGVEVEPGQAKAAVVIITDADLVTGEPVDFSEFLPDTAGGRINSVVPRYVEPAQGWKDHSAPIRRDYADIIADGGPREATLPLMLVTNVGQADRCGEILRRLARLERRASIVLPPPFCNLEEGDWIAWKSDRYFGGATLRFRIEGWTLDAKWRMRLSLREIASSVYGVPDPVEDQAERPPAPVPVDALQLFGFLAEAITLAGETSTLPAVRVRWDVVSEGGEYELTTALTAIRAEVRAILSDAGGNPLDGIAHTRIDDLGAGVAVITNGVGPDQELQVRLVPIGDPSRPVLPSNWITVSTATSIAGGLAPGAPTAVLAAKTSEDMAAEMLRGALWREYTDGLLYIGGRDVATVVQEAVEQFTDPEGSFVGSMQLLGGRNAAGTGFILNADTVFVSASPGGSAVTSLRNIELRSDASYQAVQRLDKVVEGFAETSTLVVVNDVVVGVRATNDGSVGALTFQADAFSFVDRNGGQPRYPIRYGTDGILVLEDIVIRNAQVLGDLIVGTRSIRDNNVTRVDAAKMPGVTQWSPNPQEVIRYNINLDYPAKLIALATGSHDYYASGDPEYGFEIRVDGTPVAFEGGANVRVTSLGTSGYASLGAGPHTVTVHWHAGVWNGQGNVRLAAANLIVMAAFK